MILNIFDVEHGACVSLTCPAWSLGWLCAKQIGTYQLTQLLLRMFPAREFPDVGPLLSQPRYRA